MMFYLVLLLAIGVPVAHSINDECHFEYPPQYIAHKVLDEEIVLDGKLDDDVWRQTPFTSEFVDISTTVVPRFMTTAKMLWSEDFLYIGGLIQEPEVWANITYSCHCNLTEALQEEQIIFNDNDFEVFVDPSGTTHNYKEYEMNALNQNWDLLLNKPYLNNGYENSSRLYGPEGFDLLRYGMQSAVYVHGGEINDPERGNKYWSVEIALPIAGLMVNAWKPSKPLRGPDYWRINFSRVEWKVYTENNKYLKVLNTAEDNWVWAPIGIIDIHLPERWGYVQFTEKGPHQRQEQIRDRSWPLRQVTMAVYYAQMNYSATNNGTYAARVEDLLDYMQPYPSQAPGVLLGNCSEVPQIHLSDDGRAFEVCVASRSLRETPIYASVNNERFLRVDSVPVCDSASIATALR